MQEVTIMYEELPIMDRTHALQACGGYEDILQEVTEAFLEESPNFYEKMNRTCRERDYKECRIASHGLKSAARSVGAMRLGEICYAAELAATNGDGAELLKAMEAAAPVYTATLEWFAATQEP